MQPHKHHYAIDDDTLITLFLFTRPVKTTIETETYDEAIFNDLLLRYVVQDW